MSLLPLSVGPVINKVIEESLAKERREDDGLLHCSSDLCGSLRHTQLRLAGAPTLPSETDFVSSIRMHTGTMWHSYIGKSFVRAGIPVIQEVNVTPWLPEGWGGTADWLIWDSLEAEFTLVDLKTTKGEGIRFIKEQGAKKEHRWQASAYYHALVNAGFPMAEKFAIYYLPMNEVLSDPVSPIVSECKPVDYSELKSTMNYKFTRVQEYLSSLPSPSGKELTIVDYSTSELELTMEREQKLYWNKSMGVFDLKLVPHWLTRYCPYPLALCGCIEQKSEKIGHFTLEKLYIPRSGYESYDSSTSPSELDYNRRRKETK
jgi:hypothetical protein